MPDDGSQTGQPGGWIVKAATTLLAMAAVVLHIVFPQIKIDAITVALLVIALLPWLSNLFEEVELPGGLKFRFRRKLDELARKAEGTGIAQVKLTSEDEQRYSFQIIGSSDKNLTLAGLRIEIEKRLKDIAEAHDLGTRMQGAKRLLGILLQHQIIGQQEGSVLYDMIVLLNNAVHGATIDDESFQWAIEYGLKALKTLDSVLRSGAPKRAASRRKATG